MTMNRLTILSAALLSAAVAVGADAPNFYVYAPKGGPDVGHYTPSGWMGDTGDLRYEEVPDTAKAGKSCIKISYSAKRSKGAGWAGIYWQNPNNNWGSRQGGFDLSKYKKLTFWAHGAKGGEIIDGFKMGGIQGDFGDSDNAQIGPVTLTSDWKMYTIDLAGKDLKRIIGGFCVAIAADNNPGGIQIFLKEIRYQL